LFKVGSVSPDLFPAVLLFCITLLIEFVGIKEFLGTICIILILHVSAAPPGLTLIFGVFRGFPSVTPGYLLSPPPGLKNLKKFDFLESFK